MITGYISLVETQTTQQTWTHGRVL